MICHYFFTFCRTMNSIISRLCLLVFVGVILSGAWSAQAQMVGGTESADGKWPFFAGLFYKRNEGFNAPYCGAVIWDKDTLLTAAHCVLDEDGNPEEVKLFEIYMGYNSWTKPIDIQYMFKVREIIIHPNYNTKWRIFDIALIFLDRSIDFNGINSKVKCVNHPEPLDYLYTSMCVAMGWGRVNEEKKPTNLIEVVLPILDNKICRKKSVAFDEDHHLCAGYVRPTFPIGVSKGDSGGPLVCPQKANPTKYSLVGIAAYARKPPNRGRRPSYFTKVELFEDWIASVRPNTRKVKMPAEMSYWTGFKKRWFGRLFCNKKLVK